MEPWSSLDEAGRLFTSVYGFPGGKSRCTALRWGEDRWLVFSPGAGLEQTPPPGLTKASELVLIAPAAAHTLGLQPWSARFSGARLVAAAATAARLKSKLGLEAESLDAVAGGLPPEITLHSFPGSKLGEVWVRYETEHKVFFVVCDGFTNIDAMPGNLFVRVALWLYGLRVGLKVTPLFRFNITDRAAYRAWVEALLPTHKPMVLVPCHGVVDDGPELAERVRAVMRERF